MKSASSQEIKQELLTLKQQKLADLCLRLARFKKENKELLTYLLFEAHDEAEYVEQVKAELDALFETMNMDHLYFAKKTLRKIVRIINKYSRYSNEKQSELEWRIYFCKKLMESGIPFNRNTVITNLYESQLKKISIILPLLHEDLQHDYLQQVGPLLSAIETSGKNKFTLFRR